MTSKEREIATVSLKALLFFILYFLFSPIGTQARTIKVLAIGNSFSQDAVEQYLYELAAAQGDSLVIGNAYIGGCSIDRHYDNLQTGKTDYAYRKVVGGVRSEHKNSDLLSIIRDEQWDVISLQQASPLSGIPTSYKNLAQFKRLVQSYTTNLHVEFVWHMTWAYAQDFQSNSFKAYDNDQRTMYKAIVSTMQNVLPAVGLKRIIPSGTAIQLGRYAMGDILNRDGYHLSLTLGRYIAACTWCEFLTERIVDGNAYHPDTITDEEAMLCQQVAHEACFMQQCNRYVIF
ncbi:MAG: DUF4886 domain-containing protein [Prevotella sp.]|nr:DUF4886 domain-containing protein [Prevotella sp.]